MIKKTDGDIRISSDYKIRTKHQICSDSFPLPSIETASHELANMKHFAKIDLKSAYNQNEIDDKFKEITTLNTSMRLLRQSRCRLELKLLVMFFKEPSRKSY